MIYNNTSKNLNLNNDNFAVILDFDCTITSPDSANSWSVLENPAYVSLDFIKKSRELANFYYPIELDFSIPHKTKIKYMEEWYYKNMDLIIEYVHTRSCLVNCVKNGNIKFRNGCKDFLKNLYKLNIPVIIASAGIGNVIEEFLKLNNCLYENIFIMSNFIQFENDNMLPFNSHMIHSSNKNLNQLPIYWQEILKQKKYYILCGDVVQDTYIINKDDFSHSLLIGFFNDKTDENLGHYLQNFDIVLTENSSFYDVSNIINTI